MGPVRRCAFAVSLLLVTLEITACGMTPYQNPDHREEGPSWGLFTGSEGGWMIYRKREPAPPRNGNQPAADYDDTGPAFLEAPPSLLEEE